MCAMVADRCVVWEEALDRVRVRGGWAVWMAHLEQLSEHMRSCRCKHSACAQIFST